MRTTPSKVVQWEARLVLKLLGWELYGGFADTPKCVAIAQHTSFWDGLLGVFGALGVGVMPHWLAKKELFRFPFGYFIKLVGGIPLDRSLRHNFVDEAIKQFNATDKLILGIAPEGTREAKTYWKSGFYYIALGAQVPIVVVMLDYKNKRIGTSRPIYPTGDIEKDMASIREILATCTPRHVENVTPVQVAPERHPASASLAR